MAKPSRSRQTCARNYHELQRRVNDWVKALLKLARVVTVFATLLLNAQNLFGLWYQLTLGAGQKMVDVLMIRIVMILLLSAVDWTLLVGAGALGVVVSLTAGGGKQSCWRIRKFAAW